MKSKHLFLGLLLLGATSVFAQEEPLNENKPTKEVELTEEQKAHIAKQVKLEEKRIKQEEKLAKLEQKQAEQKAKAEAKALKKRKKKQKLKKKTKKKIKKL